MTTEEEIIQNNKLIAEFLYPNLRNEVITKDLIFGEEAYAKMVIIHEDYHLLRYHYSWDWLMPVINKAIDSGFHYQLANGEITCWSDGMYEYYAPYMSDDKIVTNSWMAVVEFIKYHNQNK